jgi:hypothetical protein
VSQYHHVHLVTGREFDYDHRCRDCVHYSERTRAKTKIIGCALAPELDGQTFGQVREAFVACDAFRDAEKPRPKKGRGLSGGRRS